MQFLKRHPDATQQIDPQEMKDKIPSLLNSYLKVGAKVCGAPALDRAFKCVDFLTILDVSNLKRERVRKPRD